MNDSNRRTAAGWGATARQIAGELVQAIQLRRDLADLEIRHDRALLKRFLLFGGLAAALVLSGVPLLLTAAALGLSQVTELSLANWLVLMGVVLVVPGTVALVFGIRKVCCEFCGLQSTLAELREDAAWVREWANRDFTDTDAANTPTSMDQRSSE
ncbi:MAG: phage holin family protein [Pirellulaceae bacterium]